MAVYRLRLGQMLDAQKFQFTMDANFYMDIFVTNTRKPRWRCVPLSYLTDDLKEMADWLNDKSRPGRWGYQTFHTTHMDTHGLTARWLCRIKNPIFWIEHPDTALEFKMRWFNATSRHLPTAQEIVQRMGQRLRDQ